MLTYKLPKRARSVVKEIRKHVKKPKRLPVPSFGKGSILRFGRNKGKFCPLGLLPYATNGDPDGMECFDQDPPFGLQEIIEFFEWWDDQTDPQSAVDAVWGKRKK